MTDLRTLHSEDQRLRILQYLAAQGDYTAHEDLIGQGLAAHGHRVGRDVVRGQLTWLAEQGLVQLQAPGGFHVATVTRRGSELAQGVGSHPGVARVLPD